MDKKLKICFVAPYSYSLFNPSNSYRFGGAEIRTWMFSTALSKIPANEVYIVTFDHGQGIETYGDVTIYPYIRPRGTYLLELIDDIDVEKNQGLKNITQIMAGLPEFGVKLTIMKIVKYLFDQNAVSIPFGKSSYSYFDLPLVIQRG